MLCTQERPTGTDATDTVRIDRTGPGSYRIFCGSTEVGTATFFARGEVVSSCGWGLDEDWRGRGVMTRALPMLLADLTSFGVRTVHTVIACDNEASQRLAARCGFQRSAPYGQHHESLEPYAYHWELRIPAAKHP